MVLAPAPFTHAETKVYDYLIHGATVYDGVRISGETADVAVRDGRIVAVGARLEGTAKETLNASGLTLAPGFIDAHTHSDFNPLSYPNLPNKLLQGVTTEVTGNCGMSAAPVYGKQREEIHSVWAREGVEIPAEIPWDSVADYRRVLEQAGMLTNHVFLVGHGNLRGAVMGFEARRAGKKEIQAMKKKLREALKQGASGLSFGLVYLPGVFADRAEIESLCSEVKHFDGVCAFHVRSEGERLVESIAEALEIGRKTGVKIQLSHLKAGGEKNWPKIDGVFRLIQQTQNDGVRVAADVYPYTSGYAELAAVLPAVYYERPHRDAFLKDKNHWPEIEAALQESYRDQPDHWKSVALGAVPEGPFRKYGGLTLHEIAHKTKHTPEHMLLEILAGTNFHASAFYFNQSEEIMGRVLAKNYVAVGSDSIADGSAYPHPRAYGTFPKVFREFVREKSSLVLGRVICKMTSQPAAHFGLRDRGQVRAGFAADLVIFDPEKIRDTSEYAHPSKMSLGVQWVFVNGVLAVSDGRATDVKAGRFLKLSTAGGFPYNARRSSPHETGNLNSRS